MNTVLDSTYYKLRDIKNKVLLDIFHINRLKLTYMFTPAGTVNTQQQLNKAIQGVSITNTIKYSNSNIKSIQH